MADLPSHPNADDPGVASDRGPAAETPRWKLVIGIILAIVVVGLFAALHLTGVLGPAGH